MLLALLTNDLKVRQAVGEFTDEIPLEFKSSYESLLKDESYDTKEIAFMKLWKNFPNDRSNYLEKAKDWIGGNDKSLRILFLTFAIENESVDSLNFYQELVGYTAPKYETSVRQNAIISVLTINPTDQTVIKNLVNATTHYKWQFSKFGREKIRELLPKENFRRVFELLLPELKENEKLQLRRLLDEKL